MKYFFKNKNKEWNSIVTETAIYNQKWHKIQNNIFCYYTQKPIRNVKIYYKIEMKNNKNNIYVVKYINI